jgi:hypothetical protein
MMSEMSTATRPNTEEDRPFLTVSWPPVPDTPPPTDPEVSTSTRGRDDEQNGRIRGRSSSLHIWSEEEAHQMGCTVGANRGSVVHTIRRSISCSVNR